MIDFKGKCANCQTEIIIQAPSEVEIALGNAMNLLESAAVPVADTGEAWSGHWEAEYELLKAKVEELRKR